MTVTYVSSLPISRCQNVYTLKNKHIDNKKALDDWVADQNIVDIFTSNINCFLLPTRPHELVEFVVNPDNFLSIDDLSDKVVILSKYAAKHYFIAVNKFLIYTKINKNYLDDKFDYELIAHLESLLPDFCLQFSSARLDDTGNVGNFLYPVTQLALSKL